jgi:hypothetical protein
VNLTRWVVRGFQGLVQMLEDYQRAGLEMDDTTVANLAHYLERAASLLRYFTDKKAGGKQPPGKKPGQRPF